MKFCEEKTADMRLNEKKCQRHITLPQEKLIDKINWVESPNLHNLNKKV